MNFDNGKDFDQNMNQLIHLLKKIIKNIPNGKMPQGPFGKDFFGKDKDSSSINVNFCFFNFLPLTEEDLEEMEDMMDQFFTEEQPRGDRARDLSSELNASDLEFLKRNGIRF